MRFRAALCFFVACNAGNGPAPAPQNTTASSPPSATATASAESSTTATAPVDGVSVTDGSWNDSPIEDGAGRPRTYTKLTTSAAYVVGPDAVIVLRRGECFGSCPVYSVGVRGDGAVFFYGHQFTQTVGFASSTIAHVAVAGLFAFLAARAFVTLHTHYVRRATDHPLEVVILRQGASFKYVDRDSSNDTEPRIEQIEDEVDRVAGTARWIGKPAAPGGRRTFARPPSIPGADLRNMAGARLRAIEQACAGGHASFQMGIGIDDVGIALAQGATALPSAAARAYDCVSKQISDLAFPVVGVYSAGALPVTVP